jgi:uncharacterized protein (DUF4415 family)
MMKDNYDFSQGERGTVQAIPSHQTKLTILIDNDILEWFGEQVDRQGGGDYLTLINEALRDYVEQNQQTSQQKTIKSTRSISKD